MFFPVLDPVVMVQLLENYVDHARYACEVKLAFTVHVCLADV